MACSGNLCLRSQGLVYVAGRLQLEEPGEQCGKHTPSAPEEVQQQHLSKFHVEFFDLRLSLTKGVRLFHARWSILAKSCLVNSHGLKVRKIREAQLNKGIVDMVAEQLLRLHFFWLL